MADYYPGDLATPQHLCMLADEYRKAAHLLLEQGRKGEPLTRAPFRQSAIHAIELYLNALLLDRGHQPARIRGMQHDLCARTELLVASGLTLRLRTAEHLRTLHQTREYLVSRYGPELVSTASQVNRLLATLEEVATKVTPMLATG